MSVRDDIVEDRPWSVIERDHDPVQMLLDRQCGVIARWQALHLITEKALRHKVASGRWRRVHRGVFVGYGGPLTDAQRWWIATLALKPTRSKGGAVWLGGITALLAHGLTGVAGRQIHVIVAGARRLSPPAGVVVHRVRPLPDSD